MSDEYERKWRLDRLPDEEHLGLGIPILQGYFLVAEPYELRIRRIGILRVTRDDETTWHFRYYLTIKEGNSASRLQWESEIPEWVFNSLLLQAKDRVIEKTRYRIIFQGVNYDIDWYHSRLDGLLIVEVEFGSEEVMREFVFPENQGPFAGITASEVTGNPRYYGVRLGTNGLPE